jgi:hypothetical protein
MLTQTLKAILILGAVASLPESSRAGREWFWDNGKFVPDVSPSERLPDLKPTRRIQGRRIQGQGGGPGNHQNRSVANQKAKLQKAPGSPRERDSAAYSARADLERPAIQRQRADLLRQQAALQRREAQLAKLQANLEKQQAKLRQQTPQRALPLQQTFITCEAAAAVVADFGFQEVKPELCKGSILRFGAVRDGTKFAIELAPNGELTKVRRIPE